MNFTNALLVCLVATQLPVGAMRTAWVYVAVVMLTVVALRAVWDALRAWADAFGDRL